MKHSGATMLAAMVSMMQSGPMHRRGHNVKETPDLSKDHAGHIAQAAAKRERKLAYNRRVNPAREQAQ